MLFATLRQHRKTSQLTNAREKHEAARRRWAEVESENTYAQRMANFYSDEVAKIDHTVDYWRYAEMKQKLDDCKALIDKYTEQAKELYAKAQARGEDVIRITLENKTEVQQTLSRGGPSSLRAFRPSWINPKGDLT